MTEHLSAARILLVDDEPAYRLLAERFLTAQGYQVVLAADLAQARQQLQQQSFALVLLDLSLPPQFDPRHTIAALAEFSSQPVIILTGHAERELALTAIAQGAWDFIAKPVDPDLLAVVVKRAIGKHQLELEVAALKKQKAPVSALDQLIGTSKRMVDLRSLIERIAPTEVRVLVTGPSGTGKELVSRAIHQRSLRQQGPFISVHCGAIPADLLESELFGYSKGAFTGADRDRPGLLSLADGGTLFLDEIGEMPLPMQVKMLRVLQEGTFYPVGGRQQQQINVRIISATNAALPDLVKKGKFREDLYYRIQGMTLDTPGLQERQDDIPLLLQHFLQQQPKSVELSAPAIQWFMQRAWPGHVRELKHTLESVVAIAQQGQVTLADIQLLHPADKSTVFPSPSSIPAGFSLDEQLRALEVRLLMDALASHQGNRSQAARALGLSRQGLLKKIERYGLAEFGLH